MPPFMQPGKPSGDFRQNLTGASNGKITGANGGTQQLGAAALRRLASGGGAPTPVGPNMADGGLNPGEVKQPPVRTPPIMDPNQKPPLPGFSAAPGMTPYQPDGGGGSVGGSTAGDPGAKLSSFGPGDGVTGSGYVPNMPGAGAGQGGSPNMGGAGLGEAALIAKLSGSGVGGLPGFQPAHPGGPPTFDTMPGMNVMDPSGPPSPFNPGDRVPGPDGGFQTQPDATPWMPQVNGPNTAGGGLNPDMKPDPHGGGGVLGGAIGGAMQPGTPGNDTRPPMNTKPMPGRRMIPPGTTTSPWAGLAGAGAAGPGGGIQTGMAGPRRGMASF